MQENNNSEKTYTSSKGEVIKLKDLETTHLSNALAKAYRDSFSTTSKKEFEDAAHALFGNDFKEHVKKINDLKEEMHRRINDFYEKIED